MKKTLILFLVSTSLLFFNRCITTIPTNSHIILPNTLIIKESFSLISPDDDNWISLKEDEQKNRDTLKIWKYGPYEGIFTSSSEPYKEFTIFRKYITDLLSDEILLRSKLEENAKNELKKILSSQSSDEYFPDNLVFYSNDKYEKDYYRFYYSLFYQNKYSKEKYLVSDGMGQFLVYLPKFYKENKIYYLFIYREIPYKLISNELIDFVEKFKCVEDSL